MDKLDSFLERYKSIKLKDIEVKELFCLIVKNKLNLEIKPKQISLHNFNLKIKTSSIEKSEIILNKKELLKSLINFKIKDLI
ncbi:MAG: hypothetical protein COX02_02290 [Candidatus Vogelbacteria bacterium CG22_combo_CG10-13_8_21_14_all_37_9]|uniref:Uncharacterized protein n=1 Tax=Candidatus Vogelbacteria bacterium CG22_combo_CG10-13_8_21_14_all_37_9 TaxID=1975046 RepID=A0A2H0BKE4_9BACT|nr:MAG: hypothetical protein BK005_01250 [bacterium CG10_37_50]PIP58064.1 MAG: hypothetical protein COX02_02290 [Candidatus Vogelbacteria bacterium CG22_combo_CG10-13_8_21_14_all_37_9]